MISMRGVQIQPFFFGNKLIFWRNIISVFFIIIIIIAFESVLSIKSLETSRNILRKSIIIIGFYETGDLRSVDESQRRSSLNLRDHLFSRWCKPGFVFYGNKCFLIL